MRHVLTFLLLFSISAWGQSAQMLTPISNDVHHGGSGGTITLGQTTGTTANSGNSGVNIYVPFILNDNASNYTLASMVVNINSAAGNLIANIYTSRSTTCPTISGTVVGACPDTKKCTDFPSTAATSGDNNVTPTSCGTFSAKTMYWFGIVSNNNSLAYNGAASTYCGTTGFSDMFHVGSFTLPSPTPTFGANEEETGCLRMSGTFTCVGSCGNAVPTWTTFTYLGNTATATTTAANLLVGTNCLNGTITTATQLTGTTYQSSPVQGFLTAVPICPTGSTTSAGTLSVKRTTTNTDVWSYTLNGSGTGALGSASAAYGFWWQNTGNTMANGDSCDIGEISGGNILTWHLVGSSGTVHLGVELSGAGSTDNGNVAYSLSTWYWLTSQNNSGGTHHNAVYDTTGTIVGSAINIASNNPGNPTGIRMLDDGSCPLTGVAGTMYYGPIKFDPLGTTYPIIGDMFFPDGPKVIGPDLSAKVHEGLIPHATMASNGKWFSFALGRYL